jgi:hypothetical protein
MPGTAAEQPVGGGDDRVEMRTGDGTEHEDERGEPQACGDGVLQQLQPDVVR